MDLTDRLIRHFYSSDLQGRMGGSTPSKRARRRIRRMAADAAEREFQRKVRAVIKRWQRRRPLRVWAETSHEARQAAVAVVAARELEDVDADDLEALQVAQLSTDWPTVWAVSIVAVAENMKPTKRE